MGQVDWSALTHAFGPATDVPRHLRALCAEDVGVREAALDALYGTIWHQGTLFPATAAAVPELLALVDAPDTPDRPLLLLLLADIGRSASFGDDACYVDSQAALQAGVPVLVRRLASDDEVERIAATVALAWADDGTVLADRLTLGDDGERLVTVYALAAGRQPPPASALEPLALASDPALGLAARIGLVRSGIGGALGRVDPEGYAVLAEVVSTVAPQALPQPVELLDAASIDLPSVRNLAKVLAVEKSHRAALPLVEFLLSAALPDGYEEPPTPLQAEVLAAVARSPGAWVYAANTTGALAEAGIDVLDQADLCARLGVDPPEAREREDTSVLLGTSELVGVRYEELEADDRTVLERFVDTLDALGWNETRHWHQFVTSGSQLPISPIGVGRHFNERAVLECTLWLFDEHVAADTGERTGDRYVRVLVADKHEEKAPVGFRAYLGASDSGLDAITDRLDAVLRLVDRFRPTLDRDNFGERFLHDLYAATGRVEIELADGRVAEIRPRT